MRGAEHTLKREIKKLMVDPAKSGRLMELLMSVESTFFKLTMVSR